MSNGKIFIDLDDHHYELILKDLGKAEKPCYCCGKGLCQDGCGCRRYPAYECFNCGCHADLHQPNCIENVMKDCRWKAMNKLKPIRYIMRKRIIYHPLNPKICILRIMWGDI